MDLLGESWAVLGRSWAVLGGSWALLGVTWAVLATFLAILSESWAFLGESWVRLGRLERLWGRSWEAETLQLLQCLGGLRGSGEGPGRPKHCNSCNVWEA